mgnify:CR=1 FL=1
MAVERLVLDGDVIDVDGMTYHEISQKVSREVARCMVQDVQIKIVRKDKKVTVSAAPLR